METKNIKKNYSHIFRAQLSRYEIAMAVYNAVNYTRSTKNVVKLLKKYDMLNGFYYKDLFLTTINLETEVVNQKKGVDLVLTLLDSYLESRDTTQN